MMGIFVLAQASQPAVNHGQPSVMQMLMPIFIIFLVFYFIAIRPRQKEQKQREDMLKKIKKYDKVMTIGGIIGTVMEVRENEVIVKVDDNSNTRMKFTRGAIQKVLERKEETTD